MRSISPFRLAAFAAPFLIAPIVFAAQVPSWIADDERACMAVSADEELGDRLDAYDDFYEAMQDDLRAYRRDVRNAWLIIDDAQRKTYQKQVDRDYATRVKNRQSVLADRLASYKENKADTDAYCKQRTAEAKKFVSGICTSNADCASGKVCTVQFGACDSSCPYGSIYCQSACAGTCVKP